MLVFISISSSISVSLCRDDVIITVEFGVTRQAEWAVPNGLQHPPRRRWATTSGEGLKGWIDSTYGHISGSSPNSRKIDSPNSRKIGDVKKLWIFYLPIGIFLEGKETMRRELENWYGTKESWIKWCHFNVRLPCDCKKLFVNYPATAYLPAHNYTWLPEDYLTGPDLLHFEALLELQVVRSYTPWVAQRSHRHLEKAIQSWLELVPLFCLCLPWTFWKNAGNHIIILYHISHFQVPSLCRLNRFQQWFFWNQNGGISPQLPQNCILGS